MTLFSSECFKKPECGLSRMLADKIPSYFRPDTIPETSLRMTARLALRLGHSRFDQADDNHHDSASNASTTNAGKN